MCASVRERPSSGKCDAPDIDYVEALARRVGVPGTQVQVWLAPLDLAAASLNACAGLLSPEERERASRFTLERDNHRYIAGRAILRILLGRFVNTSPQSLRIESNALGKPVLADPPVLVHFNLSHAGGCALIAISRDNEVGVDIETLGREVDHDALAQRFFSAGERAQFELIPAADRRMAFLTCWTRKEAVAKALGHGLRMRLDEIEVIVDLNTAPAVLRMPAAFAADWTLHSVDAGPEFVATLALRRPPTSRPY